MSSSSSPREIIQISLGPSANAVTAHLLNLQGLAATSSASYCDPNTTHYLKGNGSNSNSTGGGGTLVPRVLLIDEATHHVPSQPPPVSATTAGVNNKTDSFLYQQSNKFFTDRSINNCCWDGSIQVVGGDNNNNNNDDNKSTTSRRDDCVFRTASALAYSQHSRYYRPASALASASRYHASTENSRHVVWDDDDEEAEEDDDDYEYREERRQQAERNWKTETAVKLAQELDQYIAVGQQQQQQFSLRDNKDTPHHTMTSSLLPSISLTTLPESSQQKEEFYFNHWKKIWMPPRDEKSIVVLPYSSQSQLVPHWNVAYQYDGGRQGGGGANTIPFLEEWKDEVLFERVRHLLESCDYGIQGVTITTEGYGMYASLATYLLEELQQECKSAGRLVYQITEEEQEEMEDETITNVADDTKNKIEERTSSSPSTLSWQENQVERTRKQISSGLALSDLTEKAHAILPLQLSSGNSDSLSWFRSTARIALALESCTLPFRFTNGPQQRPTSLSGRQGLRREYRMGLQNAPFLSQGEGSDTNWGSTATSLTFSEYLQVLQPSSAYSMLELDTLTTAGRSTGNNKILTNQTLYSIIQKGTSIEQDQRAKRSRGTGYRSRPREVPPGSWLQDSRFQPTSSSSDDSCSHRGILSSLSHPTRQNYSDRSLHYHFALSTAVRPILSLPSAYSHNNYDDGMTMSNYLTCLVQSMGIQYRPERSIATVLNQSVGQLTHEDGGDIYGAGSYWKYIIPDADVPTMSVLGNTTRVYPLLSGIAMNMKDVLKSSRFRGYYTRDIMNGVLPEREDCEEALEACLNKRDVYQPPDGSGLVENDED